MPKPGLHLDEDASKKSLQRALLQKGHDVTRTPNPWMPLNADDEMQLLGATAKGRVIFAHNIGDFLKLAQRIHTTAESFLRRKPAGPYRA